jgi:DNA gyrase inhibitor GyrI
LRDPLIRSHGYRHQIKKDRQSKRPQQVTLGAGTMAAKRAKYYEKKEVKAWQEIFSNWLSKCFNA